MVTTRSNNAPPMTKKRKDGDHDSEDRGGRISKLRKLPTKDDVVREHDGHKPIVNHHHEVEQGAWDDITGANLESE